MDSSPSSAYDTVLERLQVGESLRTPDARTGKPFSIDSIGPESLTIRTARGGRVRISLFTFDSAVKYLRDQGCAGDRWLETKDENFQAVLNMENDRIRAASYVLGILGGAGLVDLDGERPNRVRLAGRPQAE
ncbi:MAG: hypothetical protein ACYSX0_11140 [Planctomycetota bacterium]|jgi:hypothetical protein